MMHLYSGRCACGGVEITLKSSLRPEEFQPRSDAATCGFCAKHDGVWISDPAGYLAIHSKTKTKVSGFATEQVRFHFCIACNELVYATFGAAKAEVAVARLGIFREIRPFAKSVTAKNFEGESLEAGARRRLKNWTPIQVAD